MNPTPFIVFFASAAISFAAVACVLRRPARMPAGEWSTTFDARDPVTRHRTTFESLNGVPWHEAPVPPRWHRCRPQSRGWYHFDRVLRCACGAISQDGRFWTERNSR